MLFLEVMINRSFYSTLFHFFFFKLIPLPISCFKIHFRVKIGLLCYFCLVCVLQKKSCSFLDSMELEGAQGTRANDPAINNTITIIDGKYRIFDNEVVGRGALSAVKRCEAIPPYIPPRSSPNMKLVVKVIDKQYITSITQGDVERATAEVKREVRILQSIPNHENIATFLEYIETPDLYLLFFEEVQCGDLCEIILRTENGKLSEEKSKYYVYQVIKAVLHCHLHDVCHRDIKPENLLVSADDNLKLTDFGLAKHSKGVCTGDAPIDPLSPTALMMSYPGCECLVGKEIRCTDVIGTPRYGAPEMFYASFTQTYYDGFQADTWSIGVVTFIILSGHFPFCAGANATEKEVFRSIMDEEIPHSSSFSPLAMDFIEQLLQKDPVKRLPLYQALQHPWLAEVVAPRKSIIATQIRRYTTNAEVLEACGQFDEEVKCYQKCIAEILQEKRKLQRQLESKSAMLLEGPRVRERRAQTPTSSSYLAKPVTPRQRATTPGATPTRTLLQSPGRATTPRARATSYSTPIRESATSRAPILSLSTRRTTPLRTGVSPSRDVAASPSQGSTTSAAGRGTSLSLSHGGTTGSYLRPSRLTTTNRPVTPRRISTPREAATVSAGRTTPLRPSAASVGSANNLSVSSRIGFGSSRMTLPKDLSLDEEVLYKGRRAVVRFNGATNFAPGTWIGLEMLEGEGISDGSSFVDKRSYFSCPKGKGVFARASQISKIFQ